MLTDAAKAMMLDALFDRNCRIALLEGSDEIIDQGYGPQPINFFRDKLSVESTNEITFGPWYDNHNEITGYRIIKNGIVIFQDPIDDPRSDVRRADEYIIPAGAVKISI